MIKIKLTIQKRKEKLERFSSFRLLSAMFKEKNKKKNSITAKKYIR